MLRSRFRKILRVLALSLAVAAAAAVVATPDVAFAKSAGKGEGGKGEGGKGKGDGKGDGKGEGRGDGKGDGKGEGKGDGKGEKTEKSEKSEKSERGDDPSEARESKTFRTRPSEVGQRSGLFTDLPEEDARQARLALSAGRILPLADILGVARGAADGRVLDVALRRDFFGSWTYRVTLLSREGRYSDVSIDAGGGDVLDVRRR